MFIVANKPGQLANRLFLFSKFIAFAKEYNVRILNPSFDEYAELFQSTSRDLLCSYPSSQSYFSPHTEARKLLYYFTYYLARTLVRLKINGNHLKTISIDWDVECRLDDPEIVGMIRKWQVVFAQGWQFNCDAALQKHASYVREHFTPLEKHLRAISDAISAARTGADLLIGVHVRHGDYKQFLGGKYYYEFEKYGSIIDHVEGLFPSRRVRFLVCSNASEYERKFSGSRFSFGPGTPVEDLYSLARCDYLIGPPSTFTLWASFYGNVPLYQISDPDRKPLLEDFSLYFGTPDVRSSV